MTLYFVSREVARGIGRRVLENRHQLVSMAQVIVIVDKKDQWLTTKDRFEPHGQVVHPRRRAELLENYKTYTFPTNMRDDEYTHY